MDCKQLPTGERPALPRPIDPRSGPRSPRCWSHIEARLVIQRRRQQDKNRMDRHSMSRTNYNKIKKHQGGTCPCGNRIKHIDHDRRLARACAHPREKSCKRCWRGLLCFICNSDILGRGYTAARLRALANYLDSPPAKEIYGDLE
jgi:hypothetical protein